MLQNRKWFTLAELVVSIVIGVILLTWMMVISQKLLYNFSQMNAEVSMIEEFNIFKEDLDKLKNNYPNFVFSTWWVFAWSYIGYDMMVFSNNSWSWVILGIIDKYNLSHSWVIIWTNEYFSKGSPFFLWIDSTVIANIRANNSINLSSLDFSKANVYNKIDFIKSAFTLLDSESRKFDMSIITTGNKDLEWKKIKELLEDPEVWKYNLTLIK